jgi:hypothetical protein
MSDEERDLMELKSEYLNTRDPELQKNIITDIIKYGKMGEETLKDIEKTEINPELEEYIRDAIDRMSGRS